MPIHDILQRKITDWTVRVGVLVVGACLAIGIFIAMGGME